MGTTYKTRHSLVNLIFSSSHACHHLSSTFLNLKAFSTIGNHSFEHFLKFNLLKMTRIRQEDIFWYHWIHFKLKFSSHFKVVSVLFCAKQYRESLVLCCSVTEWAIVVGLMLVQNHRSQYADPRISTCCHRNIYGNYRFCIVMMTSVRPA